MDLKEKELLLKDLSARLPYGVWLNVKGQDGPKLFDFDEKLWSLWIEDSRFSINDRGEGDYEGICEIKPYLRPMSSMTEEERNEYFDFRSQELQRVAFVEVGREEAISEIIDWLLSHHFDIRELIEKGLALEAPKGMY
jgi:hypothetical protein